MDDNKIWLERRERWESQPEDARGNADIDYARVIHSTSFRQLQGKTQILNLGDSDFYRTRLTHSLEVAQIAGGIASQLAHSFADHPATSSLPDRAMIQTVGCTHDLGHPPFGHGGEVALNYCMRKGNLGFEGNGQTLRILSRLESFSAAAGANLCRRTLLGVLKYPVPFSSGRSATKVPSLMSGPKTLKLLNVNSCKPPKCYLDSEQDVVDWILEPLDAGDRQLFGEMERKAEDEHAKPKHKSLDCSIMDAADDIAYGVHDLEDVIALGLVTKDIFATALEDRCPSFLDALKERYPGESGNDVYSRMVDGLFGDVGTRKRYVGRLVHHFVTAVEFEEHAQFEHPFLRYRVKLRGAQRSFLDELQELVVEQVITSPEVQHLEFKGQGMVVAVFEAMQSDPHRLLPRKVCGAYEQDGLRAICDYIAGMTDGHLLKTYDRLFSPRMGSVFDRL